MNAKIRLTRFALPTDGAKIRAGWPLSILAEGTDIPSEVFVYKAIPAGSALAGDQFEAVASIPQLYELPRLQGVSVTNKTAIPFYRAAQADFSCRSPEEVEEVWTMILADIEMLVRDWNASANLASISQTDVTAEASTDVQLNTIMPTRFALSYHPAGDYSVVEDQPVISNPSLELSGWLPVSAAPASWPKPSNARFFYNMGQDSELAPHWPPIEPYSGHQFYRNGLLLPHNVVYKITKDALWWLNFNPDNVPGYVRIGDQAQDGNAPWPLDYVNRSNPGSVSPALTLMLFK